MIENVKLNDGHEMPIYGFGTFQIPPENTYDAVRAALDDGIRLIDTAAAYFNEKEVGEAVRDSGIPRDQLFITSKLWLQDYGFDPATKGIETSLRKLNMDYMDLYLLHQPYGDVEGAWKALEAAKESGKIRSIGVSNMTPNIWNKFVPHFATLPVLNQVECNPLFQQRPLRAIMDPLDVRIEAWGPLGQGNSQLLKNPVIEKIAQAHGKDAGQIILRFEVQDGVIVIPRSVKPARIKSNMDIFDFELTSEEMDEMRALDTGKGTHNPEAPGVAEMLAKYDVHQGED